MDIQTKGFISIEQATEKYFGPGLNAAATKKTDGPSFGEILRQKSVLNNPKPQELKFSKHASVRLEDRNISLTEEQLKRLNDGARKAEEKGIKDSLVIIDQLAFIVNVPNNTVITAMDSTETAENVFTNINGAVIM
ncbi:MAG: flagellar protein [Acetatifactor sp.]|nr:flagellar protein [Acetatifactor sp.]